MTNPGWQLRTLSGPDGELVTLEEIKNHCRVDADITEDDDLLRFLVETAIERAEDYTKRSFAQRVLLLTLTDFPRGCWAPYQTQIYLPGAPVQEVIAVKYVDPSGETQTLAASAYQVALDDDPPYICVPVGSLSWPSTRWQTDAVTIEYKAGYARIGSPPDASTVPKKALQAVRLLVGHWYRNRESVSVETRQVPAELPQGFEWALDPLRIW